MALFSVKDVKITGLAVCLPANEVSNLDYTPIPEKERALWIKSTGINKRYVAPAGVTTADLCQKAASKLLTELAWEADSIDMLVFVSQTPDYVTPATAAVLQDKLGLSKSCMAFDINLGCSGYPYGLSVVSSLLSQFKKGRGLLLVGDVSSACLSADDKSAAPIFSDAGTATALEFTAGAAPMHFNLQTDGSGFEAIIIPDGGYRNPITVQSLQMENHGQGIDRNRNHLILNGIDIFNFSVREVPPNVTALLNFAELTTDDVDHFVFHQANLIINNSLRKKLKLDEAKVPLSLGQYANTSSATIPVTMVANLQQLLSTGKDKVLMCGFGVGLSWGSALVDVDNITCLPVITY